MQKKGKRFGILTIAFILMFTLLMPTTALAATPYAVTVNTASGGTIALSPDPATSGGTIDDGTTVTVTGTPDPGYALTDVDIQPGPVTVTPTGNDDEFTFVMVAVGITVTPVFTPIDYDITLNSPFANGDVTSSAATANIGDTVTLTVTPDQGYELDTLTVEDSSSGPVTTTEVTPGASYTFVMPADDVTVDATFALIPPTYTITIDPAIANGTVTTNVATAAELDVVTITIAPDAGFAFDTLTVEDGSSNPITTTEVTAGETYTFVMPADDVGISATFAAIPTYAIALTFDALEGTVTTDAADESAVAENDTVTVSIVPEAGFEFVSIDVVGDTSASDITYTEVTAGETYTFDMPGEDVTIIVIFAPVTIPTYAITIDPAIADGTVTTDVATAAENDTVTITVLPDAGFALGSLEVLGDTSVTLLVVTPTSNDDEYEFIMPDEDVTISATFVAVPLDGWVYDDSTGEGKFYYYENGVAAQGWQVVDGYQRYFDLTTNEMALFWQIVEGEWRYFGEYGGLYTGWAQLDGNWYYFGEFGAVQYGLLEVDGFWRYFDDNGVMLADGDYTIDYGTYSITYYINAYGGIDSIDWPF